MAQILEKSYFNRKVDTPEGSAIIINKMKEKNIEVNIYVMKKGFSFYLNQPKSEGSIKTYWLLSGLLTNTVTQVTYEPGCMIVLEPTDEVLHIMAVEETQLLVHSFDDNSFDKTEEGFRYIFGLLKQIQDKDAYTLDHSNRVHALAKMMGVKKGYSGQRFLHFLLAAKYHDVGKIYVPDHILNKPSALNAEEYAEMKSHIIKGKDILNQFLVPAVYNVASQHHERMDGSGYPQGLKGHEISEEGRIIAICDSYDAMTSERIYKAAKTHEEAIEELRTLAGIKYDAELVELFIETIEENEKTAG